MRACRKKNEATTLAVKGAVSEARGADGATATGDRKLKASTANLGFWVWETGCGPSARGERIESAGCGNGDCRYSRDHERCLTSDTV